MAGSIENFRIDPASDWRDPVATSPYLIHMMLLDVVKQSSEPINNLLRITTVRFNDPPRWLDQAMTGLLG